MLLLFHKHKSCPEAACCTSQLMSRSFRPTVDAPWYGTSDGQLMLMTSVAVAILLVFIVSVSVFLWRRAKRAKTAKGPM